MIKELQHFEKMDVPVFGCDDCLDTIRKNGDDRVVAL